MRGNGEDVITSSDDRKINIPVYLSINDSGKPNYTTKQEIKKMSDKYYELSTKKNRKTSFLFGDLDYDRVYSEGELKNIEKLLIDNNHKFIRISDDKFETDATMIQLIGYRLQNEMLEKRQNKTEIKEQQQEELNRRIAEAEERGRREGIAIGIMQYQAMTNKLVNTAATYEGSIPVDSPKKEKVSEEEDITITKLIEQYEKEFYEFCTNNPVHKLRNESKKRQYISASKRAFYDVKKPRDLTVYYMNHDPAYPPQNCKNGLSKFLEFLDLALNKQKINGYSKEEWRSGLRSLITSEQHKLDETDEETEGKLKHISEAEVKQWMHEIDDKYKPILYLLLVSGMRLTQLLGFMKLSREEKSQLMEIVKASDKINQRDHDHKLKGNVLVINAKKFGAPRKKCDYALFPVEAYGYLMNYPLTELGIIDTMKKKMQPVKLNAERRKNDPKALPITVSTTRKFLMGYLTSVKGVSFTEASMIECRGVSSDIGIKHYSDPRRHSTIVYSRVVKDISELIPAPDLQKRGILPKSISGSVNLNIQKQEA